MPGGEKRASRAEKQAPSSFADVAQGFSRLLASLYQAGGSEVEMRSLEDLEVVARVRSLPVLRYRAEDEGGWTYYLVLDGAGRLAYRYNERARGATPPAD